jgi:hypothetical protein
MGAGVSGQVKTAPAGTGKLHRHQWRIGLQIDELSITGGHPMVTWPAGTPIADLIWRRTANPDLAVCFERESKAPRLSPVLSISPGLSAPQTISLRAVSSSPALTFRQDGIVANGTSLTGLDLPLVSGQLSSRIAAVPVTLTWHYQKSGSGSWMPLGTTGPHKFLQIAAAPLEKPLYDLAVTKVCGYVNAGTDPAASINKGIKADLVYDPSRFEQYKAPLAIYDRGSCLCFNNADLMKYLCRSAGMEAELLFLWGGDKPDQVVTYSNADGASGFSFQVIAPRNGLADPDPHFLYHVETVTGGTTYDPSYGTVGQSVFVETAPGSSQITGPSWWSTKAVSPWHCKHRNPP